MSHSFFRQVARFNPKRRSRLWALLRELLLMVVAAIVLIAFVFIVAVIVELRWGLPMLNEELNMNKPVDLAFSLGLISVLAVPILIGVKLAKGRPLGSLFSSEAKFRWPIMWRALGVGVVVLLPGNVLFAIFDDEARFTITTQGLWILCIALVLIPVQCWAEELIFRSYLGQLVGTFFKSPVLPILAPMPFFVWGHDYELPGLISIGVFALSAGITVWYTGGIEATTGLHIANNMLIFILGSFGLADLNNTASSWMIAIITVILDIFMAVVVMIDYRRRHLKLASS
ncbi:CAAX amino terminal protease family protein [Corynebacterium suranareeae]|uniref:CAAX amino terminal protease family protein n=1 Tax=Corynebacterium suranareeae TaxID=2506452 RepID=A0A160PSU8_9CORY|nr:CPBP family intramembrane glutamic endopeptidase [Corynebacterium suranareeae]BAU96834.1 CAAX amino terminal protease family protein [Corynebacterium suranareeae]